MSEKWNAIRQGIISNDSCPEDCMKLRINTADKVTGNKRDKAIADFEMLDSSAPYYQVQLGNRLL